MKFHLIDIPTSLCLTWFIDFCSLLLLTIVFICCTTFLHNVWVFTGWNKKKRLSILVALLQNWSISQLWSLASLKTSKSRHAARTVQAGLLCTCFVLGWRYFAKVLYKCISKQTEHRDLMCTCKPKITFLVLFLRIMQMPSWVKSGNEMSWCVRVPETIIMQSFEGVLSSGWHSHAQVGLLFWRLVSYLLKTSASTYFEKLLRVLIWKKINFSFKMNKHPPTEYSRWNSSCFI